MSQSKIDRASHRTAKIKSLAIVGFVATLTIVSHQSATEWMRTHLATPSYGSSGNVWDDSKNYIHRYSPTSRINLMPLFLSARYSNWLIVDDSDGTHRFAHAPEYMKYLASESLLLLLVLILTRSVLRKTKPRTALLGAGLILGGGLANLYDIIFTYPGGHLDILEVAVLSPDSVLKLNIADIALFIGALTVILAAITSARTANARPKLPLQISGTKGYR